MRFGWQMKGRDRVGLAESPDFYHTFPNFNIRRFQPPASMYDAGFAFWVIFLRVILLLVIGLERSHVMVILENLF